MHIDIDFKIFSTVAKEIKRSPHKVKQWYKWLADKMRPLKSTGGKIVKALAFILFFTTIAETLGNPENYLIEFFGLIISAIADGLSAFLCWICEKGIKLLAKTIPAFGGLLGAILGVAISRLLGIYFDKKTDRITATFKTKVNTRKFKIHDYLVTYITCIV